MNFHPAPIPHYRGVNVIAWALYNEEKTWGYTWHRISPGVDCGEIILQKTFQLDTSMNQQEIALTCIFSGIKDFGRAFQMLRKNDSGSALGKNLSLNRMFSEYFFRDTPTFNLKTDAAQIELILRSIPLTKYKKWRWKLPDGHLADGIARADADYSSIFSTLREYDIQGHKVVSNIVNSLPLRP
jgi:hypothetical protein